jgi:hypothetical protein
VFSLSEPASSSIGLRFDWTLFVGTQNKKKKINKVK